MKRLSIAGFGRLALVASVLIPAPLVHSADKIKFPYSPIGWESLPWFVGKEGGYYEKYGLDVEMFFQGASSEIIQAMLAGDANFAGSAGPAIISNVIGGGDVIQVAALVKTFTIPLYSQPSIKTLANLKGQKVGVSRFGAVTHITALSVLQKAGIAKDVTIVQTGGISESAAALSSSISSLWNRTVTVEYGRTWISTLSSSSKSGRSRVPLSYAPDSAASATERATSYDFAAFASTSAIDALISTIDDDVSVTKFVR